MNKKNEIKKLKERIKKLEAMSMTDVTTGLKNKRCFRKDFDNLVYQIEKAYVVTECDTTYLAILDIDDFKKINDEKGHVVGDTILKNLSRNLIEICKNSNSEIDLYRWGGEEFIFIFRDISEENLKDILLKICNTTTCNVSIGASKFELNSLNMTLKYADNELYYVKNNGKNGYSIRGVK